MTDERPKPFDSDVATQTALFKELSAKAEGDLPVQFTLCPTSAFTIAGALLLAMKHPHMPDSARRIARQTLDAFRAYFSDCPTVLQCLAQDLEAVPKPTVFDTGEPDQKNRGLN